jgi:hypothetical protein
VPFTFLSFRSSRRLLWLVSLLLASLASGAVPARATGIDRSEPGMLVQARDRALRNYGWRPEAISYMSAHTRLIATSDGVDNPCPSAVACTIPTGSVYVNVVPTDSATLDYVLNHEFIHAMEYARGNSEGTVGSILADVLELSNESDYPLAAYAARRVLGLTGPDDHAVLSASDWFHINHDILEDVGWDVANLPSWYRDAYFPYLTPGPAARVNVSPTHAPSPADSDRRTQRALDAIASLCGPVLPGARVTAPSVTCGSGPVWPGEPFAAMTGGAAPHHISAGA